MTIARLLRVFRRVFVGDGSVRLPGLRCGGPLVHMCNAVRTYPNREVVSLTRGDREERGTD